MRPFLSAILLLISQISSAAIFGVDNRHNLTPSSPYAAVGRATAIAVLTANYSINKKGNVDLAVLPQDSMCKDETFASEPSLDYTCAGFLVGPDLLVTAGHCVYAINVEGQVLHHETERACQSFVWFFDYQKRDDGGIQVRDLPASNLYKCKEIIYGVENDKAPYLDYALVKLDRPVTDRQPLKLAASDDISVGDSVYLTGYPFGTPIKVTDGAHVTINTQNRSSFLTSLDAFEGDSGGPVLNAKNEVVGILIGGTPSLNTFTDDKNKCERLNRCDENGGNCSLPDKDTSLFPGYQGIGSEVQRIAPIRALLGR